MKIGKLCVVKQLNDQFINRTIIFSAGGTGGHIFPALAVASTFMANNKVIWVGGKTGLENTLVPKAGIELLTLNIAGLRNKGLRRLFLLPLMLFRAIMQSFKIIIANRPDVVVGFGGYATFPICLAAFLLRIPVIIHEQNSIAGLSNRILAKFASKVLVAFNGVLASSKTIYVGNPVRLDLLQLKDPDTRYQTRSGGLNVLVLGGSLGAKIFNDTLPEAFARCDNIAKITHQVGRGDVEAVSKAYAQLQLAANVVDFIDDMASVYKNADLIICRAGAATVSEIAAIGIAAVFVPYPYAVDDHQRYNAMALVDAAAAYMIIQAKLTIDKLVALISNLQRSDCLAMAQNARKIGITDSSERIVMQIKCLLNER